MLQSPRNGGFDFHAALLFVGIFQIILFPPSSFLYSFLMEGDGLPGEPPAQAVWMGLSL